MATERNPATGRIRIEMPTRELQRFCHRWKVAELALFGSVLRHDFGPQSDIDVLIEFGKDAHWSLFEWVDMIDELRGIFGRNVDLVSKRGLRNPFRRRAILAAREVVYAA